MPDPTPATGFVHLHLHSEYSLLDGGNRLDRLVARVRELGMNAVGVTDHGNLFGAVAFYEQARAAGVRPILGVEAYVTPWPGKRSDRKQSSAGGYDGAYHLVLLAETDAGWRNLLELCSEAYLNGFYYRPRVDRELLERHADGLIAVCGHLGSEIGDHLLDYERGGDEKHWEKAVEAARWHAGVFAPGPAGPRFYVELQHHIPEQNAILPHLVRLARALDVPVLADNDAHFLREEDHDAHDTLVCISMAKNKDEAARLRYPRDLWVKDAARMRALCDGEPAEVREAWREGCDNTLRVADRCNVTLPLGLNHAPMVRVRRTGPAPSPEDPRFGGDAAAWYRAFCETVEVVPFAHAPGLDDAGRAAEKADALRECDAALRDLSRAGFRWRYGPGGGPEDAARRERLERELGILGDKGIAPYFLIVWDFVNWGRQRGIPALARGSGVGTMVGYVLGLSNACPERFGLLFERFTDPDRSEFPDIDIDLCQDGRAEVIEYVRRKYGHVAQIITFGTLKARAAVRDVGRVLGMPLPEVDALAKMIPEVQGTTLDDALASTPELRARYDGDPRVKRLIDHARTLEGQARHASVHAAGVIVATRRLQEIVPLYRQAGAAEHEIVTQWDGPTCEKMGLLKMDFLGLRTISVIERTRALVRENLPEEEVWRAVGRAPGDGPDPLDLDRLEFNDPRVFDLFRRGETAGVFQFESDGMRRLLVDMKPDRLEDLIAANALFRPGPMDLIPEYNRRKHGQDPVPAVHEIVDRFTRETYGVMVYQEQVMQIVHGLGGIPLRAAYTLIKHISKKKQEKIGQERPRFVEGAVSRGLPRDRAEELFELILKFAGYGFNKSHSTGYAIVAYQTAYLKTYFPVQYMAAFLTYESRAQKVTDWMPYLDDCRRHARVIDPADGRTLRQGIDVRPPDVNISSADFTVAYDPGEARTAAAGHLRFGLGAVKGAGDKAVGAILRERRPAPGQERPFTSLFDFCERVPGSVVNKATIEALIRCGAFDSMHGRENRAAMVASIDAAVAAGQRAAVDRAAGQSGLFGLGGGASAPRTATPLAKVPAWTPAESLAHEKDVLGFYVSSHPLDDWAGWIGAFRALPTAEVRRKPARERVLLGGIVGGVRAMVTKNGKQAGQKMASFTIEDRVGSVGVVLFPDAFARYGAHAVADAMVFVIGEIDLTRAEPQVIADRVLPIDLVPLERMGWLDVLLDGTLPESEFRGVVERAGRVIREAASPAGDAAGGSRPLPIRVFVQTPAQDRPVPIPAHPEWSFVPTPASLRALREVVGPGCFRIDGRWLGRDDDRAGKREWRVKRGETLRA